MLNSYGCSDAISIYSAELNECSEGIFLKAGLSPLTVYTYIITDGRFCSPTIKYAMTTSTDSDGNLSINFNQWGNDKFSSFAGTFVMNIYDEAGDVVELTIGGKPYYTVGFRFFKMFGEVTTIKIIQ